LAFAIGIFAGNYIEINSTILTLCIAIMLLLLIILHRNYTYKTASGFGVFVILLFILLGNFIFVNHNKTPYFFEDGVYSGTILESPQEKQNSYKSVIRTTGFKKGDSTFQTNEKIIVYFSKSENVKQLKPGNNIVFETSPQSIKNYGNPYEFDYKNYLQKKRIYRQVYLAEKSWKLTTRETQSIHTYSELIRDKLLHIYHMQNLGANETEILSALTLGYKRDLEPETKRIFSAAGAMHVLAVSGLHVGIIFMVFMYMFGFLRRQKTGKYIFVILAVLLLWAYAFITGLSPSVMRASSMFTIVIIGTNINRRANIYNSLAASAIFLLFINPNNLFEVGFQLSYAAVFGIVFLQPKFEKIWQPKNKVVRFFWTLLTVSIAAQLATFPLSSYYFGQFPSFFWLTNLIVIPAVTILIPLGILLLMFSKITVLATLIAFLIKWLIKSIYMLLQSIEHLPFSIFEISFSTVELLCLFASLFFVLILIENRKSLYLKLALLSFSVLFTVILITKIEQYNQREIIVYNNASNTTIQLITGRKNYVISEKEITHEEFFFRQINDVRRKKRLANPTFLLQSESFEDTFLLLKNGFCVFEGKSIYYGDKFNNLPQKITPDFFISKSKYNYQNLKLNSKTQVVSTQYVFEEKNDNSIYSLKTAGAFQKIW
jgi:competence protein ComEC